ncbi:hypothetical protein K457DRAFT_1413338 [Linnemannia elongata AG-77]|uniref:Uncharacterized protein n=1 Tax=Linnemannia elongata AG-77 TaxID=1314771 RepID=A0A197JSP9_9FUNG|nr:hypothetical protein K457DRAFT_1413338 [Linnemannia elongata AG-77]
MTESSDEPFPQNQEGAKRFKGGQKRKQPGSTAFSAASTVVAVPPFAGSQQPHISLLSTNNQINNNSSTNAGANGRNTAGPVYQQPISIQHQQLPAQFLQLDQSMLGGNNGATSNTFAGQQQHHPYQQPLYPQQQQQQQQQQPQDARYHPGLAGAPTSVNSGVNGTYSSEVSRAASHGCFVFS